MRRSFKGVAWWVILGGALALPAAARGGIIVFSSGMVRPATISQAPAGFGTHGGEYFVPDIHNFNQPDEFTVIQAVPATGGSPVPFATVPAALLGGLFLPSGFGAHAGQYLGVPDTVFGVNTIEVFSGDGSGTPVGSLPPGYSAAAFPVLAFGGNVFYPTEFGPADGTPLSGHGGILKIDSSLTASVFVDHLPFQVGFSSAFAPAGFGAIGGDLLAGDPISGQVVAYDSGGNLHPFTSLPLGPGQVGVRGMAFAPGNFGGLAGDLIVSIAASNQGGGTLGGVYAVDGAGQVVATLQVGSVLSKFDPSGLAFTPDGQLLVSDDSDPIILADASDFAPFAPTAAPEPSTWLLATLGLVLLGGGQWVTRVRGNKGDVLVPC